MGPALEIEDAVGGLHGRVEERHVGQGHRRFRLHAVEAQALASGGKLAFAEAEEFGLLGDGEGRAVAGGQVHGRAV